MAPEERFTGMAKPGVWIGFIANLFDSNDVVGDRANVFAILTATLSS